MSQSLINKYNIPGPRYTSYPTVPYWEKQSFSSPKWKHSLIQSFNESNQSEGISLYIHLPFCESLCTFCGCNKRITKRHEVETPYIHAILKEWNLYCELLGATPKIKELHLGGGTPTFFKAENLKYLLGNIFNKAIIAEDPSFSFEGHPNNTQETHLSSLYELGFRRVSYGVQDYNLTVQKAIHRIQPFENVKKVTDLARKIGYESVGHDIIFGLPFQNEQHIKETLLKTQELMPDRIAFYSYAHVPWIKGNGQRGFKESDLPSPENKRKQYELGKKWLSNLGYTEVGMDHFSLKKDSLYKSMKNKSLHRNFMGYTESKTQVMIGLGVSSIGDSWYGFAQNEKNLEDYYKAIGENRLPVFRGHILSDEDLIIRKHILNLMCQLETSWDNSISYFPEIEVVVKDLAEMENDELIIIKDKSLKVTDKGRPFVRNVCMAFDLLLKKRKPDTKLFSMTI